MLPNVRACPDCHPVHWGWRRNPGEFLRTFHLSLLRSGERCAGIHLWHLPTKKEDNLDVTVHALLPNKNTFRGMGSLFLKLFYPLA